MYTLDSWRLGNLQLFTLGEPVPTGVSDSCSWLIGEELNVVFCCCRQSTLKFGILCILRWLSAQLGCRGRGVVWVTIVVLSSCQLLFLPYCTALTLVWVNRDHGIGLWQTHAISSNPVSSCLAIFAFLSHKSLKFLRNSQFVPLSCLALCKIFTCPIKWMWGSAVEWVQQYSAYKCHTVPSTHESYWLTRAVKKKKKH